MLDFSELHRDDAREEESVVWDDKRINSSMPLLSKNGIKSAFTYKECRFPKESGILYKRVALISKNLCSYNVKFNVCYNVLVQAHGNVVGTGGLDSVAKVDRTLVNRT